MQVKLIVTGGKANKREVVINVPASIGRSSDADLTVGHRMISRKHCETYLVDGLVMIRDVGSLNGIYVRGQRVREAPLPPNEKFTIGPITFRVSYEYSGDRSKLPPVVPAEPDEAEGTLNAPSSNGEPAKKTVEPAEEATYGIAGDPEPQAADSQAMPAVDADDELDFELAIQEALDEEPKPEPSPAAQAQPPAEQAPPKADAEVDFEMADDDFELAVQESLEEELKTQPAPAAQKPAPEAAEPKPDEAKEEAEKDPEDQLLDDFLNDLQ